MRRLLCFLGIHEWRCMPFARVLDRIERRIRPGKHGDQDCARCGKERR